MLMLCRSTAWYQKKALYLIQKTRTPYRLFSLYHCSLRLEKNGLDLPHVWDIWGGFLSLTSILDISTALKRPRRRTKQYRLQLVILIELVMLIERYHIENWPYIYIYLTDYIYIYIYIWPVFYVITLDQHVIHRRTRAINVKSQSSRSLEPTTHHPQEDRKWIHSPS